MLCRWALFLALMLVDVAPAVAEAGRSRSGGRAGGQRGGGFRKAVVPKASATADPGNAQSATKSGDGAQVTNNYYSGGGGSPFGGFGERGLMLLVPLASCRLACRLCRLVPCAACAPCFLAASWHCRILFTSLGSAASFGTGV